MPDDFQLQSTFSRYIKSLYTDDGLTFFTWGTKAYPQRSPIPNDKHDRVYFLSGGLVGVTASSRQTNGGTPGQQYMAGVPQPKTLSVAKVDNATPDDVVKYKHTFYWEANGNKYQETEISQASGDHFEYTSIPAKEYETEDVTDGDGNTTTGIVWKTPASAVPVVMIEGIEDNDVVKFTLYGGDSVHVNDTTGLRGGATVKMELKNKVFGVTVGGETKESEVLVDCDITLDINWSEEDTRAYVVTYVNLWGEEGPPSDPVIERFTATERPQISGWGTMTENYRAISAVRIYRTATGTSGTQFFFVDEVGPDENTPYVDERPDYELGEELPSEGWYPPEGGQDILESMPNGILVSSKGSTLNFSHAYLPHAWNPLDSIDLGRPIVAMKSHESGLVAVTDSGPFLISGVSPDAMTATKMSVPHAALNSYAITRAGQGVIYASHDGLVMVSGATGSIQASMKLWTRADWDSLVGDQGANIALAAHDGKVIIFGDPGGAYVVDVDEAGGALSRCDDLGQAAFVLPNTDRVYFAKSNIISMFQGSTTEQRRFYWQSKLFKLSKPTNFSIIEVDCDGEVLVTVWADEGSAYSFTATGYTKQRLPSGFMARDWSVTLNSQADDAVVRSVTLANSRRELANV